MKTVVLFLVFTLTLPTSANDGVGHEDRVPWLDNYPVSELLINGAVGAFWLIEYSTGILKDVSDNPLVSGVGSIDGWFSDLSYSWLTVTRF